MQDLTGKVPEWVPVFPLPEAVLFPRQILPLHIFEARYREMISDARKSHGRVAIALLKNGYEPLYFSKHAPIHAHVGVGHIAAFEGLDDGKMNILLRGEVRALISEEDQDRPYRMARIQPLTSRCSSSPEARATLKTQLCDAIREVAGEAPAACEELARLFEAPLSLGDLSDVIAGGLPISGDFRQKLLEELDVCKRVKLLLQRIRTLKSPGRCQADAQRPRSVSFN